MTFGVPEGGTPNTARIPSIAILGADALLAALPATSIQLAHACSLAGYQSVVPASWGDELIAAASLRALRGHGELPAIQCSCPYVAHRLLAVGTDLRPFLVSLVAPPVVLARYLRSLHAPRKLRITYVGRCPGAADEAIDARLTPEELLATFADHQIVLEDQPQVFDSVIPPDRRRFRSQPGGLPTPEMLWATSLDGGGPRSLVELYGDELPVELAQHLLGGKPVLIDVAPKLGCVCSGAGGDVDPAQARARVIELEPPRASSPILDESVVTEAALALPASPRSAIDVVSPPVGPGSLHARDVPVVPNEHPRTPESVEPEVARPTRSESAHTSPPNSASFVRRYSPARGIPRPISGSLPTARDAEGKQLPRSYVARRRSSARAGRNPPGDAEAPIATSVEPAAAIEPANDAAPHDTVKASTSAPGTRYTEPTPQASTSFLAPGVTTGPSVAAGTEAFENDTTRRAPPPPIDDEKERSTRYPERAVVLPVTPLSDASPREEPPPRSGGEQQPVMQLLTLGLLIAMIVLVSAAVGVLVGRWMTQR